MMKLYSGMTCLYSHRCRFALSEKGIDFESVDVDLYSKDDVNELNQHIPVLVDRDLMLYEANIINEYIDERYPYPALMPLDPILRGRTRLHLHRYEQEIFAHANDIERAIPKIADKARLSLRDNLMRVSAKLTNQEFLLGDEFTLLDVALAPLLWRLDKYAIKLGKGDEPLMSYSERIFKRKSFIDSLTSQERAMRK